MLAACKDSGNDTVDSGDGEMNVTFDVNWSNMPTKPTGLTLCFYPLGGIGNDTIMHFDVVDKVSVTLPEQDYSVICFNQSETEFPEYKFDLSSYESASVSGVENSSLKAGTLAVASMNSVNSSTTRALNLMGVLKPTNVVRSMSLKVHVEGLRERVEVHGSLSNMCTGVTMCDRKPTAEVADLPLPPEVWNVTVPDDVSIPTELTANFATFGVLFDDDFDVLTRAASDVDLHNILHITVKSEETGEIVYEDEVDVTEEVVEQYLAAVEAEAQQDITDAFFPKGYDANNVAAWYAYESVEDQSGKRKVLAVYLFNDGSFITTKHKFGTDSIESREIENIGRYSMTKGDFSNGEAVIQMDSAGGNVTIVSNVLTVNVNGQEIEEKFWRQWGSVPDATSLSGEEEEQGESADAFFPYGFEEYKVAAWYAYSSSSNGKEKVTAVYLFENNVFVTTRRTVDNGVETREIEAAGAYLITSGDLNNGQLSIYAENIEENSDSTNTGEISVENPNMSATIQNGVMTVYEGKEAMEEQYTRQTGAVPDPQLPTNYESELVAEAFFPEGYESKTVAAWYGWSQYDAKSQKTKVLAVFLFDDNTFVTTKRKYEDGVETREIEASGRYEMEGNYSNGQASIYAAAGLDTMLMSVTIVNDVMTVYENGQAMEETFTRQYGDVPSAMSVTNGESDMSSYAFFPISYEKLSVAAWYAYSNADSAQVKILAVYLFDNGTFVSTKRKYENGEETRVVEASGRYEILQGDYSNGQVDIYSAAGLDTMRMSATIENDVMTVYENGQAMEETFTRQYIDVPSGMSETAEVFEPEVEEYLEPIDLGLSVRWANMNVGASSVSGYGDHFAWGETSTKNNYSWSNYSHCNGSSTSLTKYCPSSDYGTPDSLTSLQSMDDAATVNLEGEWRTPTKWEWQELIDSCQWKWTTWNDVPGYLVTGPNENFIFLPAAGWCFNDNLLNDVGSYGNYWASSVYSNEPVYANCMFFYSGSTNLSVSYSDRYYGFAVRAVCPVAE
ncbi:MAG: DUF5119 domain-containing protein [Paludibacteraceae bacterium]|nr:DUF5119 domain-containing protein [Paludibacteraceae bacterium]